MEQIQKASDSKPVKITKNVFDITIVFLEIFNQVTRVAFAVSKAVSQIFNESKFVQEAVKILEPLFDVAKLGQVLLTPLYVYKIGESVYDLAKGNINLTDATLNVASSLGSIAQSLSTLLKDLAKIGTIPLKVLDYLWPFDVIGITIDAVSMISNARGWYHSAKFAKDFRATIDLDKNLTEFNSDDYRAVIHFIQKQDPTRIKRVTSSNGTDIMNKVTAIALNALETDRKEVTEEERVKAKKEFVEAMQALRGRVKSQITSHKVSLVTTSVNIVASATLLATTVSTALCPVIAPTIPILAIGCQTAKAAAGVASLGNFINKVLVMKKFNNSILVKKELTQQDHLKVARAALLVNGKK